MSIVSFQFGRHLGTASWLKLEFSTKDYASNVIIQLVPKGLGLLDMNRWDKWSIGGGFTSLILMVLLTIIIHEKSILLAALFGPFGNIFS